MTAKVVRKHRIVLDVTFSLSVTEREAIRGVRELICRADVVATRPVLEHPEVYIDKAVVKRGRLLGVKPL